VVRDYLQHLERIDSQVEAFRNTPPADWTWRGWVGFYVDLQQRLGQGSWGYVSNPAGGFMGFWWGWYTIDGGELYLQLEHHNDPSRGYWLAVKVAVPSTELRSSVRDYWGREVVGHLDGLHFVRPKRMGHGQWMTVALLHDYLQLRSDGCVDLDATAAFLRRVTSAAAQLTFSSRLPEASDASPRHAESPLQIPAGPG
jgi:hypothetical protein